MKRIQLAFFLVLWLSLWANGASAQAAGNVSEEETLYNGVLSIEYECDGYGDFNPGDGTEDYAGVSIGNGSSEYGCSIAPPGGSYTHQSSGEFYGYAINPPIMYIPVTASGNWNYYASFFLWFWECDPESDPCVDPDGDSGSYIDWWGFLAYADSPAPCPLNELYMGYGSDDWCYGNYSGDTFPTNYSGMGYAYAGDSWGNTGTFYVDALAIGISPISNTAYGGDSVTFTAEVSNTGGWLPAYQWTLVSGVGGPATGTGGSYTYTAPLGVTASSTATIKGCVTNLTSAPVCQTVSVDLIAETITVDPPSPSELFADGSSTSYLTANITNASEDAVVSWAPPSQIQSTGNTTATYTAPASSATLFPPTNTASGSNTASVGIVASVGSPAVTATTSLTLVEPVTITNVSPSSWTAGTANIPVTITGTGFSAASQVTISSPSWPAMTYTCAPTTSHVTIPCSVTIPANLSNMAASQGATISVSTTTSGLTSSCTYATTINIVPVVYTYSIGLQTNTSSVTYGSSATITPVVTCKVASTGAACSGNVSNPQLANFTITNGVGLGSLSNTSSASSTVFTDIALIGYPAQNVSVSGCASIAPTVCATTNFSIPATTITLNPASLSGPLTAGRTQPFTASIQNEGTANSLTWTLTPSPSSAAPGTLTSATTTITQQGSPASGTSSNTYTAPNPITAPATVTLNVCMAANVNICATPVAITLWPPPTFTVTPISTSTPLSLGHTQPYTFSVSALYGFNGTVTFSASALPTGVTGGFSPASIALTSANTSGTTTLTLTSAYSPSTYTGPPPTYTGQTSVTVAGTSGSLINPTSFTLTTRPLQYKGACNLQ